MSVFDKILKRKKGKPSSAKQENVERVADGAVKGETKREVWVAQRGVVVGVLRSAHSTEKTSDAAKENKYVFSVSPDANKVAVKRAVEGRYGVNVLKVNTLNTAGKERKRGKQVGWKPGFKKAVVTVKEGQTIEIQ